MRGTAKNRPRIPANPPNSQENQYERKYRPPVRRKFEHDRTDIQPQRAQRVDYNRLKNERAQEVNNQKQINNSNGPELHKYAHSFHYQSDSNNDLDEPTHAKKLVIVNNKADRIGSGRFSQQQRTQERGQQKREERMRRCTLQSHGRPGGANEFHLDVPSMPIWQNTPISVQLVPTNINAHHTGVDHLVNTSGEQMDQSTYIHNFVYPSPAQGSSFNGNTAIYFTHPATSITNGPTSAQPPTHFHQHHPGRSFENSNHHHHHHPFHLTSFQSPLLQPSAPMPSVLSNYQEPENISIDFSSNFRRLKSRDHENKLAQQRPISNDFEGLQNTHHLSSSRFNNDNRIQSRPQTFYDFSPYQQSNNNNNNNGQFRSSNNNRYQRNNHVNNINNNNNNNNNTSLPLSAYMTTDESLNECDNTKHNNNNNNNNTHWATRRRPTQQRTHQQDKHQFPLSLYDPRQYGFTNNNSNRRNDLNHRSNTNERNQNNNYNNNELNHSNKIDLFDEWWEHNNNNNNDNEVIEAEKPTLDTDSKTATVNDSGNSSLSTSMNLKESVLDDISTHDFANPPSNVSTIDSNIIESLDKLQQQLKLEEAVDERLESTNSNNDMETIQKQSQKSTTYDTAHFMQWAKEKFREELAGRLTAQEIQQHDAVTTDDDDYEEQASKTNNEEKLNTLEDDLNEKLTIDENPTETNPTILVE